MPQIIYCLGTDYIRRKQKKEEEHAPPIDDFSNNNNNNINNNDEQFRSHHLYASKRHLGRTVDGHRHRFASFRLERRAVSLVPQKSLASGHGDERTEIRLRDFIGLCVDFNTGGGVH